MNFVTSLLALIAVLIVLSTLATAFVEVIHGFVRQRVKGLQSLIGTMFDDLFKAEKRALGDGSKPNLRAEFVNAMTRNPAASTEAGRGLSWFPLASPGRLDWLDLRQFIQQLANTDIGTELAKLAAAPIDSAALPVAPAAPVAPTPTLADPAVPVPDPVAPLSDPAGLAAQPAAALVAPATAPLVSPPPPAASVPPTAPVATLADRLEAIAANFERLAAGMHTIFKHRSGLYAALAGMALAAFMNVDGRLVVVQLFSDSALGERVVLAYSAEELQKLAEEQEKLSCSTLTGDDRTACEAAAPEAAQVILSTNQATLEGLGLPIGYSYFPYCRSAADPAVVDARCPGKDKPTFLLSLAAWLLSILLTGALIGLGAPFWFDLYRRIASIAPLAGLSASLVAAVGANAGTANPPPPPPDKNAPLTKEDLVAIFMLARAK